MHANLHCSEELAAKLGAHHAERVRRDLSFPVWQVPMDCIAIATGNGTMIWPIEGLLKAELS